MPRQRAPQADRLGIADRQRLRRQFADHDVQKRDDAERDHERHAVDQLRRGDADHPEHRFEQAGEGRLANPAQAQGSQRNAELACRQVGVELGMDLLQDAAAQAGGLGDGADARLAECDDAELGRHEKAVQRYQQ
jgi:hypothetical protein